MIDFITENFKLLTSHLLKNGLKDKDSNFNLVSFENKFNKSKKNNIFLLGSTLNTLKSPKDKVPIIKSEYKLMNNYFNIYFALHISNLLNYSTILRILVDFPIDENNNNFKLLNLNDNNLNNLYFISNFLDENIEYNNISLSNIIFVKNEIAQITLRGIPKFTYTSKVNINIRKKEK